MNEKMYYDEPRRRTLRLGDCVSIKDGHLLLMARVTSITPRYIHLDIYNQDILQKELVITHAECRESIEDNEIALHYFDTTAQMHQYVDDLTEHHTEVVFEELSSQRQTWEDLHRVSRDEEDFRRRTDKWVLEIGLCADYPLFNIIKLCQMFAETQ